MATSLQGPWFLIQLTFYTFHFYWKLRTMEMASKMCLQTPILSTMTTISRKNNLPLKWHWIQAIHIQRLSWCTSLMKTQSFLPFCYWKNHQFSDLNKLFFLICDVAEFHGCLTKTPWNAIALGINWWLGKTYISCKITFGWEFCMVQHCFCTPLSLHE